jgi:DNA-binding CsgD family transcriptional regulator
MKARIQPAAISAESMFAVDEDQRIVAWNNTATQTFGIDRRAALGSLCFHLLGGCDMRGRAFCRLDCPVIIAAEQGHATPVLRLNLGKNGSSASFEVSTVVLTDDGRLGTVVHLCRQTVASRWGTALASVEQLSARHGLTNREAQVLSRLCAGEATSDIARTLRLSEITVRNHTQHVLEKLGVHSRTEALALVYSS